MKAYFQHPDTGEACDADYDRRRKVLVVTTESGEEVLRRPAADARIASQELICFGVEADESILGVE